MKDETAKDIRTATALASHGTATEAILEALEAVPEPERWTVVKGEATATIYVLAVETVYRLHARRVGEPAIETLTNEGSAPVAAAVEASDCDCRAMPIACAASYSLSSYRVGTKTQQRHWQFRLSDADEIRLEHKTPSSERATMMGDVPAFAAALMAAIAEHRESAESR